MRPRSPPSTPSAPSSSASGATCWTSPPTLACARTRRPRSSWPGPWTRCWRGGTRTSTPRGTLPGCWTSSPPGGTTAAWWTSPWTCTRRSKATPPPWPGWRSSGRFWTSPASSTPARPPGGPSSWRRPGRAPPTGGTRWPGPWPWQRGTRPWKRPMGRASRPPGWGWRPSRTPPPRVGDQAAGVDIPFPRLKGARGVEDPGAQEQIKALRDGCKKAVEGLLAPFQNPSAALLEDMALVYPAMMGLIDLVEDFAQSYAAEKKKRNLLDFSDLEHGAVRLLVGEDGSPTDLARQWGGQYAEIMVDEYQDTNQVQNAIFRALSQEGKNLFLVGDVKQSIYRFRLADPHHFPGEVPHLCPVHPGRGGGGAEDHPVQKLPLPPPGAGGRQRPLPDHHVPPAGGDGLHPGGGPPPRRDLPPGGGVRDGVSCAGLLRGPRPHPGTGRTGPIWKPGLWPGRSPACSRRGSLSPDGQGGHPAPPAGGRGHPSALPGAGAGLLHPGPGGGGGGLVHPGGGRPL